jgi:hypothetical protein
MWYRASHARRLWQTEHTAGGIQEGKNERGSRGGNHLKGWMLVVPNVRGVWFRTFLDRWAATAGRYEGAPARKRPCCSRVLLVDLLNLLSIDGEDTRGGGS